MENATPTTHPPPHPFSSPPLIAAEIFNLTTPPPPFPVPSHTVYLSPLEFFLALVAVVTVPTLIYNLIFNFRCPFIRRRLEQNSGEHSVPSDDPHKGDAAVVSNFIYRKDTHVMEIGGECSVCLSAFADGENLRQLSSCKHSFHVECIDLWLRNHSNCPICRATVVGRCTKSSSAAAALARDDDLHQGLPYASSLV